MAPAELSPMVERIGMFAGHRLPASHPWRRLTDAQLAEAAGDLEPALAGYIAAAGTSGESSGVLGRHRGTAHVGAARCLVGLGRTAQAVPHADAAAEHLARSEEHTSELQSLMRISYAVFRLKKKNQKT